jgi:LPS export ABC transporter protein LptC
MGVIPVTAVIVIAGALVTAGCDRGSPPPTSTAVRDTADQVLYDITMDLSIDGVRRIRLEADSVYNYQSSQIADLLGVRVQFYTPAGGLSSTVTSIEGTYNYHTEDMEARGDVVAVTPDGRRLTTEVLRYSRAQGTITGPEAFVYDSPDQHLEGDGFTSDPDFRDVLATRPREGRVTGDR